MRQLTESQHEGQRKYRHHASNAGAAKLVLPERMQQPYIRRSLGSLWIAGKGLP
jgi:hypothetical protein